MGKVWRTAATRGQYVFSLIAVIPRYVEYGLARSN
jgi:hypothetical protein